MPKEPTPKEVSVSVAVGGKVQLVKFELSSDYRASFSGTWSVDGMTEEEVEVFRHAKIVQLRNELEPIVQAELDDLFEQKAQLNA